jgi:hypothetical protein
MTRIRALQAEEKKKLSGVQIDSYIIQHLYFKFKSHICHKNGTNISQSFAISA